MYMKKHDFDQLYDTLVIPSSLRKTPFTLIGAPVFEHHYVV